MLSPFAYVALWLNFLALLVDNSTGYLACDSCVSDYGHSAHAGLSIKAKALQLTANPLCDLPAAELGR